MSIPFPLELKFVAMVTCLSSFIALIATSPDLTTTLLQEGNGLAGITLFVPNKSCFLNLPATTSSLATLSIPTGNYVSETELKLETQAGQELVLEITDDLVTINETVTILQGDIFSVHRMMHVIAKPLPWAQ